MTRTIDPRRPGSCIVWNDPINLMSYVTFVLQKLFGYSQDEGREADAGRAHEGPGRRVERVDREKAELDVFRLHEHGLWATMQQDV